MDAARNLFRFDERFSHARQYPGNFDDLSRSFDLSKKQIRQPLEHCGSLIFFTVRSHGVSDWIARRDATDLYGNRSAKRICQFMVHHFCVVLSIKANRKKRQKKRTDLIQKSGDYWIYIQSPKLKNRYSPATASLYALNRKSFPVKAETSINKVDSGKWKLVSRLSTTLY